MKLPYNYYLNFHWFNEETFSLGPILDLWNVSEVVPRIEPSHGPNGWQWVRQEGDKERKMSNDFFYIDFFFNSGDLWFSTYGGSFSTLIPFTLSLLRFCEYAHIKTQVRYLMWQHFVLTLCSFAQNRCGCALRVRC